MIEKILVPLAAKINGQRHICAVRDAFILIFPLTMAGSLMVLLNNVFLSPDGLIAKLLHLGDLFPNLAEAQVLFVALIVALLVGELMAKLSKSDKLEIKMPEQVPPAVARSFKALIPIIIVTVAFSILNFIIKQFAVGSLHELVYNVIQGPLTKLGQNVGSVFVLTIICQLLWVMGIHGPNTIAAVRDTMFAEANNANLAYFNEHQTAWGAPYPVTYSGLYDAFGVYGGSGCTLGLIIAIFIFGKSKEEKEIAKLSLAPGLFNINETIIFKIIPPIACQVPWTTPGPLAPFVIAARKANEKAVAECN